MTESTMITVGRWVGRWSKMEAFLLTSCWWWRRLAWQPQVGGAVPVSGEDDCGGGQDEEGEDLALLFLLYKPRLLGLFWNILERVSSRCVEHLFHLEIRSLTSMCR